MKFKVISCKRNTIFLTSFNLPLDVALQLFHQLCTICPLCFSVFVRSFDLFRSNFFCTSALLIIIDSTIYIVQTIATHLDYILAQLVRSLGQQSLEIHVACSARCLCVILTVLTLVHLSCGAIPKILRLLFYFDSFFTVEYNHACRCPLRSNNLFNSKEDAFLDKKNVDEREREREPFVHCPCLEDS